MCVVADLERVDLGPMSISLPEGAMSNFMLSVSVEGAIAQGCRVFSFILIFYGADLEFWRMSRG